MYLWIEERIKCGFFIPEELVDEKALHVRTVEVLRPELNKFMNPKRAWILVRF